MGYPWHVLPRKNDHQWTNLNMPMPRLFFSLVPPIPFPILIINKCQYPKFRCLRSWFDPSHAVQSLWGGNDTHCIVTHLNQWASDVAVNSLDLLNSAEQICVCSSNMTVMLNIVLIFILTTMLTLMLVTMTNMTTIPDHNENIEDNNDNTLMMERKNSMIIKHINIITTST